MKLQHMAIEERREIYNSWSSQFTFAQLQSDCMTAIKSVPAELQNSVRFEIAKDEEWHSYDPAPSVSARFYMIFTRPESDTELEQRQTEHDVRHQIQETRDRSEFERLQKLFQTNPEVFL